MRTLLLCCCLFFLPFTAQAREIAGVQLAEQITLPDGTALQLNGAGIRSKLFIKVYIAALYRTTPANDAPAVLADSGRQQMLLHFLYDEVSKDKMVESWNEGFTANIPADRLPALQERIRQFNDLFVTVKKGEQIALDFAGEAVTVTVAGQQRGQVTGRDFAAAVLAIWLGDKPVSTDLKKELLGGSR